MKSRYTLCVRSRMKSGCSDGGSEMQGMQWEEKHNGTQVFSAVRALYAFCKAALYAFCKGALQTSCKGALHTFCKAALHAFCKGALHAFCKGA